MAIVEGSIWNLTILEPGDGGMWSSFSYSSRTMAMVALYAYARRQWGIWELETRTARMMMEAGYSSIYEPMHSQMARGLVNKALATAPQDPQEVINEYFKRTGERWYLSEVVIDELLAGYESGAVTHIHNMSDENEDDGPEYHNILQYFCGDPGKHSRGDLDDDSGPKSGDKRGVA